MIFDTIKQLGDGVPVLIHQVPEVFILSLQVVDLMPLNALTVLKLFQAALSPGAPLLDNLAVVVDTHDDLCMYLLKLFSRLSVGLR